MNQWYLIQFKRNSHRLAERNLQRQGFETFLPMQKITRRKASRFVSDLKPLFPGYMFVSVNSELAPWRSTNSTIGVSRLVSFEGKPKPLPLQLISGLMLRCDASGTLLPPKSLNEGDSVEMLTGPFANFIATVDTIDPEQRIWVLMDVMGQKTPISVTGSMHRKMPQEDPNTGHAVAVDVRDAQQFMPSCSQNNWRFLSYSAQAKKRQEWEYKAQMRTPRPHPLFVMALDALGCVAEKLARKADRVTPASCNKVALITDGSNSDEVIVIPRPQ